MGIRQLYSGNLHEEAFQRLQSMMVSKSTAKPQRFITKIEGPELLDDAFLMTWLAMNYFFTTGFDHKGNPIMGEIGGIIPTHPKDGKLILALNKVSIDKVQYGIQRVQEARKTGKQGILSQLEEEIEIPLESRDNVTVVNGNRNVVHYDFTSGVARADPIELITTNLYLLLSAIGYNVLSGKRLHNEQYVFNIPANEYIFRKMQGIRSDDYDSKLDLLKSVKDTLIPEEFIAGFHIKYSRNAVSVQPIIAQRDSAISFDEFGVTASASRICHIGVDCPCGQEITVMEKRFFE